jgi:hypothetical protein
MSESLNREKSSGRRPHPLGVLFIRLCLGLGMMCVTAGLMIPVFKSWAGKPHRYPAGQLRADARTFVSGIFYLLRPELPEKNPVVAASTTLVLAQHKSVNAAVRVAEPAGLTLTDTRAPGGPLTNLPVRI